MPHGSIIAHKIRNLQNPEKWVKLAESYIAQFGYKNAHLSCGLARYYSKFPQKINLAEDIFIKTISDFPNNEVAPNMLAQLYMQTKRFAEAESRLLQTISDFPNDAVAPTMLAQLYLKINKQEKAVAIIKSQDDVVSYKILCSAYWGQNQPKRMLGDFCKAIMQVNDLPWVLQFLSETVKCSIAIPQYNQALSLAKLEGIDTSNLSTESDFNTKEIGDVQPPTITAEDLLNSKLKISSGVRINIWGATPVNKAAAKVVGLAA